MYVRVIRWISRVHLDKAYWSENIINFFHQEAIKSVIPCKSNSRDHGTGSPMDLLVNYQRKMPGLYKKNNKIHLRAEVEHVFGVVRLFHILLRSRKRNNKLKTLLCSFLWYNHELMIQELKLV